ncbi:MAG: acetoacetate decarboxylase family protein [Gammaproteobacteria bacterium]|nr:acetoacetate decarboxylase family protein [Gammaproteobacteria bacterium]MBT8151755.1 acetoacetate decarboxylase family protein [Gammaproteobacteria bacterium]NND38982.1 acetoacetate decarboxylase family protein [Pseudomonadales bacterium]NNL10636.1 acetoacetate decarboxylase family protein [Pseudomonadales bacterium]NNM10954.1 acetoacetate decarboxylase family protein [Pseudomonadales bacterium]
MDYPEFNLTGGDIFHWPMLKVSYRTDPGCIAELLPPGISPGAEPIVNVTIYNFPVPDVPEHGVLTTVNADYEGIEGEYTIGYGIDQESAIFISQHQNGQPKYPCEVQYHRVGKNVVARCIHQGYTFMEFEGASTGPAEHPEDFSQNEWWVKYSKAVGAAPDENYDFPPHVVHVRSDYGTAHCENVEGKLVLRDSPWDPFASQLPMREQLSAQLWWPIFKNREIKLAGKLDPAEFLPYSDVISGSRWPGTMGGPKR